MKYLKKQIQNSNLSLNPAQATMLSFLALSFIGAFLLMLPLANSNGQYLDFVTAFFMSVSSVCVTGLSLVDLGKDFTLFGQVIVLILIQIGGLSYMTFTTILVYMLGKRLSFSETKIFDISNNSEKKINFADFVLKIGILTLIIEAIGMVFLIPDSLKTVSVSLVDFANPNYSTALFQALFHSVSAFCNAGLALYSNSLESFRENYWVLWVFSFLPILGGLGYTTLNELQSHKKGKILDFSVHTKVSLILTAVLLFLGILIQFVLIPHSVEITSFVDRFWVAFFQSCAARSSGFNSIPLVELGDASLLFLIIWMFIGACPGGTGGGIKVTTLAVIGVMVWSGLKSSDDTKILNRSIHPSYQRRAMIVFVSSVVGILFFTWLITIFDADIHLRFIDVLFEVTSAFTTVGLSTGITGDLSDISLIMLCICMIIGRPGPLLFLMAIISEDQSHKIRYPEEGILIG